MKVVNEYKGKVDMIINYNDKCNGCGKEIGIAFIVIPNTDNYELPSINVPLCADCIIKDVLLFKEFTIKEYEL